MSAMINRFGIWTLLLLFPLLAYGQVAGPVGGDVRAIAIDRSSPDTLYAGTGGNGVFKTINGGTNWSAASTGLPDASVTSLAIDPGSSATLYAGTWGSGVFKSTNAGVSWGAVNAGLANTTVLALAIDSLSSTTLSPLTIPVSIPAPAAISTVANRKAS